MYRVWKCVFRIGVAVKKQDDPALVKKEGLELVKEGEVEVR